MAWANFPKDSSPQQGIDIADKNPPFAVQLVRQVNYGPLEGKRYFIRLEGESEDFVEVTENQLIQANFQKLNTYVMDLLN